MNPVKKSIVKKVDIQIMDIYLVLLSLLIEKNKDIIMPNAICQT